MGKLEQYTSYRDSELQWLGNIPKHWSLKTVKALFQERKEMNYPVKTSNILSLCMYRGVIPYAEKGNSGNRAKDDITAYKLAYPDDIVLNSMNVIAGSVGLSKYFGVVSPVYYMLHRRDKNDSIEFLNYVFRTETFQKSLIGLGNGILVKKSESTGKLNTIRLRIPMNKLNQVSLPYPPQEEQTKIASFLDEKTAQIDNAISQKEKLIELLKERRQITINEAVTKGLNKDVEFKDSGVEWIGEIPKHWEVEKVKYIFKDSSIKNHGQEVPLAATQTLGVVPKEMLDFRTVEANVSDLNTFKLVKENNFVISLRSFEGGIEYSAYRGIISPAYTIMETLQDIDFQYFKFLFKSNIFIQALNIYKTGIREGQNISFIKFKDDFLPLPPKEEQNQIAEHIEIQTSKIDKAIELQQNYIAKLKEYKASLIDSVVTGKVRVAL